jgi:hypothetical protein
MFNKLKDLLGKSKNIIPAIKEWWENKKEVIEDMIIPKLDLLIIPLADLLISKGVPANIATPVAKEVIEFLQKYLRAQI